MVGVGVDLVIELIWNGADDLDYSGLFRWCEARRLNTYPTALSTSISVAVIIT